jgi:small neutral amino acid transporter SnatA (MarC family)
VIALRYLDVVLLALALPVFVLGDLSLLGYAAGGGAWLVQRALQVTLSRRAAASDDPRTVVGIAAGSMIGRGWLVALIIFAAGLKDDDAGLAAAVLVIVLFTAYFTVSMIMRPFQQNSEQPS